LLPSFRPGKALVADRGIVRVDEDGYCYIVDRKKEAWSAAASTSTHARSRR
jgi:hypothetical protein